MIHPPRRPAPRWIGMAASLIVLVLVAGTVGLSNSRVRNHIPGFQRGPVVTAVPAGLVISLSQLPADDATEEPSAAATPVATIAPTSVAMAAAVPVSSPLLAIPTGVPAASDATRIPMPATVAVTAPAPATSTSMTKPAVVAMISGTPAPAASAVSAPVMPTTAPATATPLPVAPVPVATIAPTALPPPPPTAVPTARPTVAPTPVPSAVFLEPMKHWYQGWNQCAEMSASMALSYFGINLDPNNVTAELRPKSGPTGSKNVEFPSIVEFLQGQGVHAQAFQGGTPDRVKRLVASGVPVIVGQWQNRGDHVGIGHWRVVRGYDDAKAVFLVNDSMIDPASPVPYAEFDDLWPVYDYVYIPVWNDRLAPRVQAIIGAEMDPKVNIARTIAYDQSRIEQQPTNAELQFALGGAYYLSGDKVKALDAYRRAKDMGLIAKYPWTLWYQSWPVAALVDTGAYDEALTLAQTNIDSAKTFAIMHYQRGRAFEAKGDMVSAKREYQLALADDKNYHDTQNALTRLGG